MIDYLKALREQIIEVFQALEPTAQFERTPWEHHTGGGGEIGLLRGEIFEKAAVNFSEVRGSQFPGKDGSGPFYATGVSLITHMMNPKAPTVHFNIRYIENNDTCWFGGGYDLTPMGFGNEDDTKHFHLIAKQASQDYYDEFSAKAKEYFYIPHWKKERGVGGLFFDHFNTGNFDHDLDLWKRIGNSFLDSIMPIYLKRIHEPYTLDDKVLQEKCRAHYVEFNLLYDRGTKFGFTSGGNPKAILCSMPPNARW
jgi:coproporphyrinogen III oxidase